MQFKVTSSGNQRLLLEGYTDVLAAGRIWLTLVIALGFFSGCANYRSMAVGEGKTGIRHYLKTHPQLLDGHTGIAVFDLEKEDWVYRYNADNNFTPASNIKIFTLLAARKILGDTITTVRYQIRKDTLIFAGAGDPAFLHPEFQEQEALGFLKAFPGKLALAAGGCKLNRYGPGWAWDDYPFRFQPERSCFPVFGNRIWIGLMVNANTFNVYPFALAARVTVDTTSGRILSRAHDANAFVVNPRLYSPGMHHISAPFITGDSLLAAILSDTLHRDILILSESAFQGKEWQRIYRNDVDSIYRKMMFDSDNFTAEHLFYQVASKLGIDINAPNLQDTLLALAGFGKIQTLRWVDGSGLSRYNQVSPYAVVDCLVQLDSSFSRNENLSLFSRAGLQGIVKSHFHEPMAYAWVKSGSMRGVYSLSGYLETKSGRLLAFSVLRNYGIGDQAKKREEIAGLLKYLHTMY